MGINNDKYLETKDQRMAQKLAMTAKNLLEKCEKNNTRVIGVTTSGSFKSYKQNICKQLVGAISECGKKVVLLDEDARGFAKADQLQEILGQDQTADIILVNLRPITRFVQSLECAQLCEGLVFVERMAYSTCKDFEAALKLSEEKSIPVLGVITHSK